VPIKLTIWLSSASDNSYTFEFDKDEILVGRDASNDVQLPFSFVSSQQFTIVAEGQTYLLADTGSTNGTIHNGKKLAPWAYTPLHSGDLISVGELLIQVDVTDAVTHSWTLEESREEVRRMVWETLQDRGDETHASLSVVSGPDRGEELELDDETDEVVIGTDPDCDLTLSDELCHTRHLQLVRVGDRFEARPLEEQLTRMDGTPLVEPRRLGQEARLSLGATQLLFCDPLIEYLDDLSGLAEDPERPAPSAAHDEALSTQQIDHAGHEAAEPGDAPPDFGPPDRPPALGQPRLVTSRAGRNPDNGTSAGWGPFEISVVAVTVAVIVGGVIAILVLFDLV